MKILDDKLLESCSGGVCFGVFNESEMGSNGLQVAALETDKMITRINPLRVCNPGVLVNYSS